MLVIHNDQEFEEHYPYSKDQIKEYPKEYPCVLGMEYHDAGLMGTYWEVEVVYFPKNVTPEEAFLMGMSPKWVRLN
jgi:hypothetical protein